MLIIDYGHYPEETYEQLFNLVRATCPAINDLLTKAEKDEMHLIIDISPRKIIEHLKLDADGFTASALFSQTGNLHLLGAPSMMDSVEEAGVNPDTVVNISLADDLSPGEFAGALIHELMVHTPQHHEANQELSKYISNPKQLEENFLPRWIDMNKAGGNGLLDGSLHHRQMLNQDSGLGKAYQEAIWQTVAHCNQQRKEAIDEDVEEMWENIADDIGDQYRGVLEHFDPNVTFGAFLKINTPARTFLKSVYEGLAGLSALKSDPSKILQPLLEEGLQAVREGKIGIEAILEELMLSISSVVPDINYSIRSACIKYFNINPFFLEVNNSKKLKNLYDHPNQLGSDRIANSLAAIHAYPNTNIIIVDFGTATTICAINIEHEYLGGAILPGLRLSMDALQSHTAQLKAVEIINPNNVLGKNTTKGIQSGIYYGQYGAINYIANDIIKNEFNNTKCIIMGTGGFSHMFANFNLFDVILPDLVLDGLRIGYELHMSV